MPDIFYTSDTHFYHGNIIRYCNRPYRDWRHMNEMLVENWNSIVKPHDIVRHLGDVAFGPDAKDAEAVDKLLKRLNGNIHLYLGNHDEAALKCKDRFASIQHYDEVKDNGQRIVLFHYGLRTWHHDLRGTWHLYGHTHGNMQDYGKSTDIGVDTWDFKPVSFAKLKAYMDARPIGDHLKFKNYTPATVEAG